MEKNITNGEHSLYMMGRKTMTLSGIKDVVSFEENCMKIISNMGNILIRGSNIKIGSFNTDTGDMQLEGRFTAVVYLDENGEKQSFIKRLLK